MADSENENMTETNSTQENVESDTQLPENKTDESNNSVCPPEPGLITTIFLKIALITVGILIVSNIFNKFIDPVSKVQFGLFIIIGICIILQSLRFSEAKKILNEDPKANIDAATLLFFDSSIIVGTLLGLVISIIFGTIMNGESFLIHAVCFFIFYLPPMIFSLIRRGSFKRFYANHLKKNNIDPSQITANGDGTEKYKGIAKVFNIIKWIFIIIIIILIICLIYFLIGMSGMAH